MTASRSQWQSSDQFDKTDLYYIRPHRSDGKRAAHAAHLIWLYHQASLLCCHISTTIGKASLSNLEPRSSFV